MTADYFALLAGECWAAFLRYLSLLLDHLPSLVHSRVQFCLWRLVEHHRIQQPVLPLVRSDWRVPGQVRIPGPTCIEIVGQRPHWTPKFGISWCSLGIRDSPVRLPSMISGAISFSHFRGCFAKLSVLSGITPWHDLEISIRHMQGSTMRGLSQVGKHSRSTWSWQDLRAVCHFCKWWENKCTVLNHFPGYSVCVAEREWEFLNQRSRAMASHWPFTWRTSSHVSLNVYLEQWAHFLLHFSLCFFTSWIPDPQLSLCGVFIGDRLAIIISGSTSHSTPKPRPGLWLQGNSSDGIIILTEGSQVMTPQLKGIYAMECRGKTPKIPRSCCQVILWCSCLGVIGDTVCNDSLKTKASIQGWQMRKLRAMAHLRWMASYANYRWCFLYE